MSIFDSVGDAALREYLDACAKVSVLKPNEAFKLTKAHIRAFNNKTLPPKKLRDLQIRWYRSLGHSPDYGVYDNPLYFCDLWLCWTKYSRRYLKDIQKPGTFGDKSVAMAIAPKTVLDLGCGCGYTSAALKEIYPSAKVVGTNIAKTSQFKMANELGQRYHFKVTEDFRSVRADLLFASEYFEHWEEPVAHLLDVLKHCKPKHCLFANTFTSPSIGHFDTYRHGENLYTGKQIGTLFKETLRANGYEQQKTTLWNKRPSYWRLA